MSAYRSNAAPTQTIVTDDRPLAGFLRAPPAPPPTPQHACDKPGYWKRLWNRMGYGALWRCRCGAVYRWDCMYSAVDGTSLGGWWFDASVKSWVAAGGQE